MASDSDLAMFFVTKRASTSLGIIQALKICSLRLSDRTHVANIDTAAASELVPSSSDGKGEGAAVNAVAEISDVAELSPVHPIDSVGGEVVPLEEERAALIAGEGVSAADSPLNGGHVDKVQANLSGLNGGKDSISEDMLEESKEISMVEEPPSHDRVDSLEAEEKREDVEQVMADEEGTQATENESGQNIESEKVQVETTSQAASLEDIVSDDIEIPDVKEVASVAGFTEIPSQEKGLDDSVVNLGTGFVKEEPLKKLKMGEGARDPCQ